MTKPFVPLAKLKVRGPLPTKLSDLLELAVADARAMQRAGHRLNMRKWYSRGRDGQCTVCMAGAVLARRLPTGGARTRNAYDYAGSDAVALYDINLMRTGELPYAGAATRKKFRELVGISVNDRAPWQNYLRAAKYLRSRGL